MQYNLVPFEQWVEQSKEILESLYKDAKVYKITAFILFLLSLIILAIGLDYWPAALIVVTIGFVFFRKSSQDHHTLFLHFVIREKQVYEYADDVSGQQLETNYMYQYVLVCESPKTIKISPKGLNLGKSQFYDKVIVSKELFSLVNVGDTIDVLIGSDMYLYAYNVMGKIEEIQQKIVVNGKNLIAKTTIHQRVTNFGKRVR